MKRFLFLVAVIAVGFIIYVMMSDQEGTSPSPTVSTSSQPVTPPTPAPPVVQTTPAGQKPGQPNVLQPVAPPGTQPRPLPSASTPRAQTASPQSTPAAPNPRALEVERIIRACAKRAGWTITNYQAGFGVCRVTGHAPNDNVANQRFLEEIQSSGILRSIETQSHRRYEDRNQRPMLEVTFKIDWQ